MSVVPVIPRLDVGSLATLLSRRTQLLSGPLVLAFAMVAAGCQPSQVDKDDLTREIAKKEGVDPGVAVSLEKSNKEFYENRPTESLFNEVVSATKSSNENTRAEAFTTLATLRGTAFHERAIKEIDRMQADKSSRVKDRYVWVSYLAEHPNWKQIENEIQLSGSEEAKRLGKVAEGNGPRQPKRKAYAK